MTFMVGIKVSRQHIEYHYGLYYDDVLLQFFRRILILNSATAKCNTETK